MDRELQNASWRLEDVESASSFRHCDENIDERKTAPASLHIVQFLRKKYIRLHAGIEQGKGTLRKARKHIKQAKGKPRLILVHELLSFIQLFPDVFLSELPQASSSMRHMPHAHGNRQRTTDWR